MKFTHKFFSTLIAINIGIVSIWSQTNSNIQMPTSINENGIAPHPSAMLEIQSIDKGMLIPRMDMTTRNLIGNPATGLLIYQIDNIPSFYYYDGSSWIRLMGSNIAISSNSITDNDQDTSINVEKNTDEDLIRMNIEGVEYFVFDESRINVKNNGQSVFIGDEAGKNDNLSTNQNVFIGYKSGNSNITGENNTSLGCQALSFNLVGSNNTAIGRFALNQNLGSSNTAVGYNSLHVATSLENTGVGAGSLVNTTTGRSNSAVGRIAMGSNLTGEYNSSLGYSSLNNNVIGNRNTALGVVSLVGNSSGSNNIGVGYNSGKGVSTTMGSENSFIGSETEFLTGGISNSVALGYGTQVSASNQIRIGNSSVTSIGGYTNWTNVSDRRFKTKIMENIIGLDFILKLRPVSYDLDRRAIQAFHGQEVDKKIIENFQRQNGFIAQEVEKSARELEFEFSGIDAPTNKNSHYGLRYAEFVVPLVKGMQEQQEMIEELKRENEELKSYLEKLLDKVQTIEQVIKTE